MIIWGITFVYVIIIFLAGYFMYRFCDIPGYELDTQNRYVLFKMLASAVFLVLGIVSYNLSGNGLYFYLMPAFALCFFGDLFLALGHEIDNKIRNPFFIIAVVAFTIAQTVFSFALLIMLDCRISWTIIIPFIVVGYTIFCIKSKDYDFGINGIPCAIYGFFVGLSAALGLQAIIAYPMDIISVFIGIGSILFLISDGILNLKLFWKGYTPWAGAGVLVFYYASMWFYSVAISMYV